ncbi:alpha/beta fold hydrolase [Streptomyces boncukensis]|uniref:Alpha/beta fold hydrolase n=1 Tax=Streptomyces boncukensis TaxID=2711219 RepID=A0A6G4X1W6_9ACTN|nr:alpha/beta hydrolase [Streptomyces boncukensis]NGO71122.1 alpha/beta fold hydrolase [Streptomyces boncukensis]
MSAERVRTVTLEGFGYRCRIVDHPAPRTEPVVVLGGAYQDMYAYRRVEGPWTAVATVISVDLPGSGAADDLPAAYGFDFLARAVAHLLRELGIPYANVFGASYGAPVAYALAQAAPERIARLALAGVGPAFSPAGAAELRAMARCLETGRLEEYGRHCVGALVCRDSRSTVRKNTVTARLLERMMSSVTARDLPRHLESTRRLIAWEGLPPGGIAGVPALCFTGEHDPLTPPDRVREVAATIEGALFTTVREADHLVNLERGPEFGELLARFFTDQPLDGLDYLTPLEHPARPLLLGV